MRLRFEQLAGHLKQPLLPVYLLSGDEPLQMMEAEDAIRAAAREQGFTEREVFHADRGFDWGALQAASEAMSLFAERRLLELRLPGAKPGDVGSKALVAYTESFSPDNVLLISCGKLDKRQQSSKWFKALEQAGAVMQLWPIEPRQLPGWIGQRMSARGLNATPEAAALLAERVEGNLLAAAQEVEKLLLLHGGGDIGIDEVEAAVADSARFDLFELVDTALSGDSARTVRMLEGLRGEGAEAVLVLWALVREIRAMAQMARDIAGGNNIDAVLGKYRVWQKRKGPVRAGLQRHNLKRWQALLRRGARLDRIIKGAEPGNPWDELIQLGLLMAGTRLV